MHATNVWFLLRKLDEESLFFPIVIRVEEDGPALFGATIPDLEGSLIAMGRSPEEAQAKAIALFKQRVDSALERERPLGEEFSGKIAFRRLPLTIDKAAEMLDGLLAHVHAVAEEWHIGSAGTTPQLAA